MSLRLESKLAWRRPPVSKTAFLSSTGADLRLYRDAAFLAIQKLDGWKCIRMEDFGARDRDVDSFCRARAEECDLFVGIIGHRFGEGPKGSKESYTQREYRTARAARKPILLFLAPNEFPIPANLTELAWKIKAQAKFRKELKGRGNWTSPRVWTRRTPSVRREIPGWICAWAGGRLPSEAEWECAARGGKEGVRYPWGDAAPDEYHANFIESGPGHLTPVGLYPEGATPSGLQDLAGNCWEWIDDWWRDNYIEEAKPSGYRVTRGGRVGRQCWAPPRFVPQRGPAGWAYLLSGVSLHPGLAARQVGQTIGFCGLPSARFAPKPYMMYGCASVSLLSSARKKTKTVHHVRSDGERKRTPTSSSVPPLLPCTSARSPRRQRVVDDFRLLLLVAFPAAGRRAGVFRPAHIPHFAARFIERGGLNALAQKSPRTIFRASSCAHTASAVGLLAP